MKEFLQFGLKQLWSCLFAGAFFLVLAASRFWPAEWLSRYDFLFLAAIGLQVGFGVFGLETWAEIRLVFVFHLVGLVLEIYKTSSLIGSWSYPEPGFFKLGTVPLYSGFMYSAVGSYMLRAWSIFQLDFQPLPPLWQLRTLCGLIYLNFFTNHWLPDGWIGLFLLAIFLFARTKVSFRPASLRRRMPFLLAFGLIGAFIWLAENLATFWGAWIYPHQTAG